MASHLPTLPLSVSMHTFLRDSLVGCSGNERSGYYYEWSRKKGKINREDGDYGRGRDLAKDILYGKSLRKRLGRDRLETKWRREKLTDPSLAGGDTAPVKSR